MAVRYHENVDIRMEIKTTLKLVESLREQNLLALIMDDPDAMGAVGKVWVHWVVWNIDPTTLETEQICTRKTKQRE